jgi:hypothetical protein
MTPFEQAQQNVKDGTLRIPLVSTANGNIDYFGYQLTVHKYNLSIMSKGMTCRGVKLKDLKAYYGLKGRTAADCLPQFLRIFDEYKSALVMN